ALWTTPYSRQLQEALSRTIDAVRAVDQALARNFSLTASRILSFADGKARELIELVLMRWDLVNIRVILRAKHAGRHNDEILANLIPAGRLNEPALKEVAGQSDVTGGVGALGGRADTMVLLLAGARAT